MIVINVILINEVVKDLEMLVETVWTRTSLELKIPPTTDDESVDDALEVIFERYGRPRQIVVRTEPGENEDDKEVVKNRIRVFKRVLDKGFNKKHLTPFVATPNNSYKRFRGVVKS